VSTLTRRRSSRDSDETEEQERPSRRRRSSEDEDRGSRRGSSRRGRDEEPEEEERPRRGARRRSSDDDEGSTRSRRQGTRGFGAYSEKKRSNTSFADEFKPGDDNPTLIKFLEGEPFDSYNQHWVEEGNASGKTRHSFVCRDDEDYFEDEDGCPLCDVGEPASTYSLFNILDFSNKRKPEVKVWKASPAVTDLLARADSDKKTSPINRDDLYWEVEMVKKGRKREWRIVPVKERDLLEDFDVEPLEDDEIEDFSENLFTDRSAVTKVDSYDDLLELADSLD
jgi:hypothetical protein